MAHRILVLDDDEAVLTLVRDFMATYPLEVDAVRTVTEAREHLDKNMYSVAIVDLGLSGFDRTDGLDFVRHVKSKKPLTRIIVYTAFDNPEIQRLAIDSGADLFLVKPVPLPTLGRHVLRLCV